jgi:hypothetical protein
MVEETVQILTAGLSLPVAVTCEQADEGDAACSKPVGNEDYEALDPVVDRKACVLQKCTPCDDPDSFVTATHPTNQQHGPTPTQILLRYQNMLHFPCGNLT